MTGTIGQVVPEDGSVHEAERVEPDGSTSRLYARICEDGTVTGWQWFALADVPSVRASAVDDVRRRLPLPEPVLSPDLTRGLVVNVATWFAAPAGQWVAVTGTAEALGLSVTVTATPVELVFDPGDGAAPVTCAGPGSTFDPSAPPTVAPACSYTYRDASSAAANGRSWAASLSIRWSVTWTASDGQSGALDPLMTTTVFDAVVREYQALERNGS
ncbi:hypothetical protein I6A84_28105 [Frankia sp. CNm7]|uniref:Uncharacterized protein n=1 Tax=Frankia nepalensis TaxID=1836974 RepID=A0A937RNV4_9ACTN|nr:hypothetical protein [Frankia nepalensis]MBL7499308.1 hypothetical protein [Frankia nepalensis]MBL7515633.1 hypothetical protein [Frankia nepalensis]MBL7521840.1 hypothetical protein [Frankia nepalensis]MBL7632224.1 hypothetical protein [Frankia nepalensis]